MMNETLATSLRRLRLSGLAQSLDVRLQEATGNGLNHMEFLELLLQDELAIRADRLMNRRVKAAVFRDPKTLEDFDFSFNPSVKKKQIFELATCKFVRQKRDVQLAQIASVKPRLVAEVAVDRASQHLSAA